MRRREPGLPDVLVRCSLREVAVPGLRGGGPEKEEERQERKSEGGDCRP